MCLISYNSHGFSNHKEDVCRFLLSPYVNGNKPTILCNQENFILKGNSYKIRKALPGYLTIVKPAVKNSHDRGRPKGGMFIAVPDNLKKYVKDVSPVFWRTQAVIININRFKTLVINSYFPTDPGTIAFDDSELLETLQSIKHVIDHNEFEKILWLGDINTDFIRRSGHVNYVKHFVDESHFRKAWDSYQETVMVIIHQQWIIFSGMRTVMRVLLMLVLCIYPRIHPTTAQFIV